MRTSTKFVIVGIILFIATIIHMMATVYLEPEPTPTSSIPDGYYLSWNGDKQDIAISCYFLTGISAYEDKINFSLGTGEIWFGEEESFFLLNGNALPFTVRSENISSLALYEIRGPVLVTWDVVLYKYENKQDVLWDISWRALLEPNETVTLPSGEEVTFLGFDPCEGSPRFSVIAG